MYMCIYDKMMMNNNMNAMVCNCICSVICVYTNKYIYDKMMLNEVYEYINIMLYGSCSIYIYIYVCICIYIYLYLYI